jgi:hypothetical protein
LFIARSNSASSFKSAIGAVRRKLGVRDGEMRELIDIPSAACLYDEGAGNDDWREEIFDMSGINVEWRHESGWSETLGGRRMDGRRPMQ